MNAVAQADAALGVREACLALGLPRATWYRTQARISRAKPGSDDQTRPLVISPRALQPAERALVLDQLNSERFADTAVPQVHAILLDEGLYLCSQRTMYRILDDVGQVRERRDQLRHPVYAKPELLASMPNQLPLLDREEVQRTIAGRIRPWLPLLPPRRPVLASRAPSPTRGG